MPGTELGKRGYELVVSLIEFFEQERDAGGPFLSLNNVRERVAVALKISISTVNRASQKVNDESIPSTSQLKRKLPRPVTNIDNFAKVAIRNTIYRMYENNEPVTVQLLRQKLVADELFKGCETSLNTVLKNIGFKYQKDNPRRGLMELPNIVIKRIRFLKEYLRIQKAKTYEFVYLDETWIFQNGTVGRSWQDDDLKTVKTTKVDGKRYIVLHAGNKNGFIPGADLVFSSSTKNSDYHGEMNQVNFLNWFENKLLKNLTKPSAIIMDNAPYHSTLVTKTPNSGWKKKISRNG